MSAISDFMFVNPPLNYTGSKFNLLPQLVPLFDKTKPLFIDLFAGGGSVYANVVPLYQACWANDIIPELVGIHYMLVHDGWEFVARVKATCVSKTDEDGYYALRDSFNRDKTPEKLYALILSCTNNMMRFSRSFQFNQTFGWRSYNPNTEVKVRRFLQHIRPYSDRIHFSSDPFDRVRSKDPSSTFVYADPPYSSREAGYNAYWSDDDEETLYRYLRDHDDRGGTFALSGVVGCSIIDRMIREFPHVKLKGDYEKVARIKGGPSQEVLVTNYLTPQVSVPRIEDFV